MAGRVWRCDSSLVGIGLLARALRGSLRPRPLCQHDSRKPHQHQPSRFVRFSIGTASPATTHRLKTAGLALDRFDRARVGHDAETWEKVARKLRTHEMPPPGLPRPDKDTYDRAAASLEAALDAAATAHPNPGRVIVHRLNRTEYANAVRDLLALDDRRAIAAARRRAGPAGLRQHGRRAVGLAAAARELSLRSGRRSADWRSAIARSAR